MSTSFGVIPIKMDKRLTFGNVLEIAEKTMNDFLKSYQVEDMVIKMQAEVRDNDEKYVTAVSPNDKFIWKDGEHAWFTLNKTKTGGIEAYCNVLTDTLEYWPDFIEENGGDLITKEDVIAAKKHNVKWYFARSPGQSVLINIAYGHLAAAVAKLTDGVIHSETGWDATMMPARADDFVKFFFRPEKTEDPVCKKWAEKGLHKIGYTTPAPTSFSF